MYNLQILVTPPRLHNRDKVAAHTFFPVFLSVLQLALVKLFIEFRRAIVSGPRGCPATISLGAGDEGRNIFLAWAQRQCCRSAGFHARGPDVLQREQGVDVGPSAAVVSLRPFLSVAILVLRVKNPMQLLVSKPGNLLESRCSGPRRRARCGTFAASRGPCGLPRKLADGSGTRGASASRRG